MKHKHAEVIKAFVDGIECEWFNPMNNEWILIREIKEFDWVEKVRIKPEPQKEQAPQYLYVDNDANRRESWMSPTFIHDTYGWNYMGKVEVVK